MCTDCIRLHSAYNPAREAERFVDTAIKEKNPRCIVITEPGESHLASVLRTRFPNASLIALRYTADKFTESDSLWTAVWRPGETGTVTDFLYRFIPEEFIPQTVFVPWKPADSLWPEAAKAVWSGIAELVRLQSGILRTRTHFGKRWLTNMVNSVVLAKNPVRISALTGPVLLACSGPSLESVFPQDLSSFHVAAVSSSLAALSENRVFANICITTDGGYWARDHLRYLPSGTVLVFPPEAAVPRTILEEQPVVFLSYSSALEKKLFDLAGISSVPAERNGTVSGTAVRYLLDNGQGSVIAAGLDLSVSRSFSHARPHAFGPLLDSGTRRTSPLCSVLHERAENSFALDAYARWFETNSQSFDGRLFRIPASLRSIPGIPVRDLAQESGTKAFPLEMMTQDVPDRRVRAERVAHYLADRAGTVAALTPGMDVEPDILELLQLVSFAAYTTAMKSGDYRVLCADTSRYLATLAERITRRVR
ncbi:MAG TPA: hypothetical protein PK786_00440 [Treponemataceae bacterium]|jgi:hypothetical protein|nr:hypothetical protein [Treponemataceae bacterium]HQF72339.1 hypothetical protein [Treponemataceae bacterium]